MKKYFYLGILLLGCRPEIHFPSPTAEEALKEQEINTTIQALWERVHQSDTGFIRFQESETPLWLSGYVISSDASGNFYKELYIQDDYRNPQRGLRFLLDQTALHTFSPPGTKVFILLNGLGAGVHQGVLSLGSYEADGVAALQRPLIKRHLKRSVIQETISPLKMDINNITPDFRALWVTLEDVQFSKSELGRTYSAETFDDFDGERWLVNCSDFRSIILSTSVFSMFKSVLVDSLKGSVTGVLTRDFFNEKNLIEINSPENISFNEARCDPFFGESFETYPLGRFEDQEWINWVEKGTQYWEVYEDENSLGQSLRIGSYRSRDQETICWLITPSLDISLLNNANFSFRSSTAFADSSNLKVFYSTSFDRETKNPSQESWKPLDVKIASSDDNDVLWIDAGPTELPNKGRITFAFRYNGSGKTTEDGTYELDDIWVFE